MPWIFKTTDKKKRKIQIYTHAYTNKRLLLKCSLTLINNILQDQITYVQFHFEDSSGDVHQMKICSNQSFFFTNFQSSMECLSIKDL